MQELANVEQLNQRLLDRQNQLVSLQTAVLDLWGRCQVGNPDDDDDFMIH